MTTIKLALDWTPNANHIGFYVSLEKGWYKELGIDLVIEPPSLNYNSNETPARRLMNGEVDLCICPTESLISCWSSDKDHNILPQAIAAILADDTSAIVSLKDSNITNMKELEHKKYASYQGRFEMSIIKHMIDIAGGNGNNVIEVIPPKLDCFDAILRGDADATWIFCGWEGVIAKHKNIELNVFPVSSSGVPYGYSPILLASSSFLNDIPMVKAFLKATAKGYEYAISNPESAARILISNAKHEALDSYGCEFITETISYLANGNHFINQNNNINQQHQWGIMNSNRWELFNNWLYDNQLLTNRDGKVLEEKLPIEQMYTNDYLMN